MAGVTTADLVYLALLTELRNNTPAAILDDAFMFIAPRAMFTGEDAQYVQLVPGVPVSVDPRTGTGLVHEDFQVASWTRLFLDQGKQSTKRLTDATLGVMILASKVRQRLNQFLPSTNELTEPVRFIQGSAPDESDDHPGWVVLTETFRMGYEIGVGD